MSPTKRTGLLILTFLLFSKLTLACRLTPHHDTHWLTTTNADWNAMKADRFKAREQYFANHADETRAFLESPVGFQGLPAIVIGLLPDVMPDRWGAEALSQATGFTQLIGRFPAALHYAPANSGDLSRAVFSCGSCHTGRVQVADQAEWILGAPSNQIDVAGYRHKLWQSVHDERFNPDTFRAALNQKQPGWLFDGEHLEIEASDTARFKAAIESVLNRVKSQVDRYHHQIHAHLGSYTYQTTPHLLDGGVPGSLDAFGFTIALMIMPAFDKPETAEELARVRRDVLAPQPPMIDMMSVWRQSARKYSQWDGSIESKLIRNLGAELGAIGSPQWVNFENAKFLTPFVADMPAPPYPFDVDLEKASRGATIYQETCASCHTQQRFLEVQRIGTDPNRARSLTPKSREFLIQALRQACVDPSLDDCRASDEQILLDRTSHPGYLALPHDGLWARAPYLHNGSIPTLYHVLVPSERPRQFKRGSIVYDQQKVGFDWQNSGIEIDTETPGYAN